MSAGWLFGFRLETGTHVVLDQLRAELGIVLDLKPDACLELGTIGIKGWRIRGKRFHTTHAAEGPMRVLRRQTACPSSAAMMAVRRRRR